jgi:hypothetical protein
VRVIFFDVDGVLNFKESDAVAPSGKKGIAEARVKALKKIVTENSARLVLIGDWRFDWNFDDSKCTKDGIYLNKKLERRGLHILDKIRDDLSEEDGYVDWIQRHPNVTESCILLDIDNVRWTEW